MSWNNFKEVVKSEVDTATWPIIDTNLRELWKLARDLVGSEESTDVADDACLFLLRLFLDQKIVMLKHMSELKKIFGQVSNQLACKICMVRVFFLFYC